MIFYGAGSAVLNGEVIIMFEEKEYIMSKTRISESAHADKLRELGFKPISRKLEQKRYPKFFTMSETETYATDEIGVTWHGPARRDLSHLKFVDKTEEHKALQQTLRNRRLQHGHNRAT